MLRLSQPPYTRRRYTLAFTKPLTTADAGPPPAFGDAGYHTGLRQSRTGRTAEAAHLFPQRTMCPSPPLTTPATIPASAKVGQGARLKHPAYSQWEPLRMCNPTIFQARSEPYRDSRPGGPQARTPHITRNHKPGTQRGGQGPTKQCIAYKGVGRAPQTPGVEPQFREARLGYVHGTPLAAFWGDRAAPC